VPATTPTSAAAFPARGALAGADAWEQTDRLEELAMRAEAEEAEQRLAAAVLRQRRRFASEQQRAESRRRGRR